MSVASGPNIATNGLVFGYDMQDPQSFKGAVATNQFAIPTPDASNNVTFSVQGTGTFQRLYSGTFDNYSITNNDVVYRYDLVAAGGCYYHGNDVTITAGQSVTFTFDYYISPGAGGYPVTNLLANLEGVVGGSAADPTPSITGVWKTATITSTAGSTGTCRMLLYPGACNGTSLATSGFILYRNPQALIGPISNVTVPFTGPFGARSDTQALYDITGTSPVTANSLTYNSTGTAFSFNGTSDVIGCGNDASINFGTGNFTVSVWFKRANNATTNLRLLSKGGGDDTANQAGFAFYGGDTGVGFIINPSGTRTIITAASYVVGEWVNVVGLLERGVTMRGYKNGNLVNAATAPNGSVSGNASLFIGNNNGTGLYWPGEIAQVSIYNRALTQEEILQNFNALRGRYGI